MAAAGARLVLVGSGTPAMAREFAARHAAGALVWSDPQRAAFAAAGMRRTLGASLHWRLLKNAWRALRQGFRQGGLGGDPWQQGGVLVFAADGSLRFAAADAVGGDPLPIAAVLAALGSVGGD
jgi:hypothetical protein